MFSTDSLCCPALTWTGRLGDAVGDTLRKCDIFHKTLIEIINNKAWVTVWFHGGHVVAHAFSPGVLVHQSHFTSCSVTLAALNWLRYISSGLTLFALYVLVSDLLGALHNLAQPLLLSLSPTPCSFCHCSLLSPLSRPPPPPPPSISAVWFAGIFHHVVPSVSSHQFGATLPTSGGLNSLLSLSSSSSSTSSQTQQHTTPQPASTRLAPVSSPMPLSLSQAQHSRTQSVLHSPSPPTLSLPPPPPLHSVPSSSTSTHSDSPASSRSDSLHSSRLSLSSLHHQRAQSSLSISSSTSAASVSAAASLSSASLSASSASSSRPYAVHYSPRLPPPPPTSSSGGAGSMWRTQSMHGTYTTSQLPSSRPR